MMVGTQSCTLARTYARIRARVWGLTCTLTHARACAQPASATAASRVAPHETIELSISHLASDTHQMTLGSSLTFIQKLRMAFQVRITLTGSRNEQLVGLWSYLLWVAHCYLSALSPVRPRKLTNAHMDTPDAGHRG